jgi:hypothetical protein
MMHVDFVGVEDLGDFFERRTTCFYVEVADEKEFEEDPYLSHISMWLHRYSVLSASSLKTVCDAEIPTHQYRKE